MRCVYSFWSTLYCSNNSKAFVYYDDVDTRGGDGVCYNINVCYHYYCHE